MLRYRDCRYRGLNMLRKGWKFIAQADHHPSYHFPKNAVSVYSSGKRCTRRAAIECDRFGGQQCTAARV